MGAATADTADLHEQRTNAQLRLEIAQLQSLAEAFNDWVDPRQYLYDDPAFNGFAFPGRQLYVTTLDDRKDGRFRPLYETEQELAMHRAAARNLALLTGIRTGALDTLANYILGRGFEFTAAPEIEEDDSAAQLARAVQDTIDRFLDDNDFNGVIDRETHHRSREDGECLIAFDEEEIRQGRCLVEFLEPDQLCEPANSDDLLDWIDSEYPDSAPPGPPCWKFGVLTPENKTWKPLGYHIVRDGRGADWDFYPAHRVEHIKRNVTRNAKRGVSDFVEIVEALRDESKLAGNMVKGGALQAAIAWILQGAPGTTQSQLQSVGGESRLNLNLPSPLGPNATSTTRNASHYPPGSIIKAPHGQEYKAGPMGAERNAGFEVVGQYALRRIGTRWNMPENMISGDASNGNYSSLLVAEGPFVKAREADQQFFERHFLSLLWKVVRVHVESGRFQRFGIGPEQYDDLLKIVRIDCEAPTVASRDPKMAVDTDKVLHDLGVMSLQTIAARNGLDFEKEQKLGAKKAEPPPQLAPFANAMQPGVMPPDLAQANADKAQEKADQAAAVANGEPMQAAVEAALESVYCTDEAKAILSRLLMEDCGTGAGGFKSGNTCGAEEGGGSIKAPAGKKPSKSKEEKFEEAMASKSETDRAAFRKAQADGVAIPPAWTEVTYHGKDKPIQAEGRDAKGRKQRVEDKAYRQRISDENNARIAQDLAPRMGEIRKTLAKDAAGGNEEAKVLSLITQTGFRIGGKGDGKAKVEAFGATTLLKEHATVDGNTVTFDFPGKKGVRQQHTMNDPVIAKAVRDAKTGERIFKTSDAKVRDAWQTKYGGQKVHDIRHVVATETAKTELGKRIPPPPKSAAARTKLIKEVAKAAGAKLGNNPSQALGTYIDPGLWTEVKVAA